MIKWKIQSISENILHWLARKMPRLLRYWATIVSFAEATTGQYGDTIVPELTVAEMLKRIER